MNNHTTIARREILKAALSEIGAGGDRFVQRMQAASLQLHSHDKHFNLQFVSQSNQLTTISGRLIGIHSLEGDYFVLSPNCPTSWSRMMILSFLTNLSVMVMNSVYQS